MATLREIDEYWSIIDVLDANQVLDIKEDAEIEAFERSREAAK